MKTVLFFLTLMNCAHIDAQTITAATVSNWINGACCGSGTSYTVSVKLAEPAQSVRIEKIYLYGSGELEGFIYLETETLEVNEFKVHFGARA